MNPRIAILAALPREIAPLVKYWPRHSRSKNDGWTIAENDRAIAICAGMGRRRIEYAFQLAAQHGPLRAIYSAGYAGALRPEIRRSTVYWPSRVVDGSTGESFECPGGGGTLVTAGHVIDADEKPRLAAKWDADLVDMETATLAQFAKNRNLPFYSVRVVSDELADVLPDFSGCVDENGGIREFAMAAHLLTHPAGIPRAMRFARRSPAASFNLAAALREAIESAE